ncbi:MAG: acetolactate decarboxylase [Candidatus Binataceae bacterium]
MHHEVKLNLPEGLWRAIQKRRAATGESIRHIVNAALARHLEVDHRTLFQVSTSAALVQWIYDGAVTIATLREHGDLGLGTFEHLDGEMIALDGEFYQVRSDGSVRLAEDTAQSPFAVVTRFAADDEISIAGPIDLAALCEAIDRRRGSNNLFYAIRIDAHFDHLLVRAACKSAEGVPLVEATSHQAEFEFSDVRGTIVGFWAPVYSAAFSIAGYHFHFLSADRSRGGHLLRCEIDGARIQLQREGNFQVALPESAEFLKSDLTRDPSADLDRAEKPH